VIEVDALTKRYGETVALDDVSLRVPPGSIFGLVGPNGAGKTTLLSILAGLRTATSGRTSIDAPPSRIAVLPDAPRFDPWLTGREVVGLAASLSDVADPEDATTRALDAAGITEAADRRVGGYSRGMLQRAGIAATIVGEPEVMILDEPASALDPEGRREVLDLVRRSQGAATVIFSSHILRDVQEVSDTLGILRRGRLLYAGAAAELLLERTRPTYLIRLRDRSDDVATRLRAADWVAEVEAAGDRDLEISVTSQDDAERHLVPLLAETSARVIGIEPHAPDLESVFMELTR
jgi:ABC-2 type transport system ATP-binding protein